MNYSYKIILIVISLLEFFSGYSQKRDLGNAYIFFNDGIYTKLYFDNLNLDTIADKVNSDKQNLDTKDVFREVANFYFKALRNDTALSRIILNETDQDGILISGNIGHGKSPRIVPQTKKIKYTKDHNVRVLLLQLDSVLRSHPNFSTDSIVIRVLNKTVQDTKDNLYKLMEPWNRFEKVAEKNREVHWKIFSYEDLVILKVNGKYPNKSVCKYIYGNDKPFMGTIGKLVPKGIDDIYLFNTSKVCVVCSKIERFEFSLSYGNFEGIVNLSELKKVDIRDSIQVNDLIKELGY
jgi:hypothetical protein